MARIRTIKPEAFSSDSLSQVPVRARWTFAGVWTYLDDAGRGRDDARLVKAAVYPLDDDITHSDVAEDLDALVKIGCLRRYEVEGKRFLFAPGWHHQKISHPSQSKLPEPPTENPVPPPPRGLREPSGVPPEPSGVPREHANSHFDGKARELAGQGTAVAFSGNPPEDSGASREPSGSRARAPEQGTGKGNREREQGALRASAREAPSEPPPNATTALAAELVDTHQHGRDRWTEHELHQLRRQACALLGSGAPALHVTEGLRRLAARPDAGPGLLPHLTHDAMRGVPSRARSGPDPNAMIGYHHEPNETEWRAEVVPIEEWMKGA